jgi:hypothetical protein
MVAVWRSKPLSSSASRYLSRSITLQTFEASLYLILLGSKGLQLHALCERTRTRINIVVCFKQNESRPTKLVSGKLSQAIG